MQQFFAEPSWITESEILIRGADLNHMKNVLRMKVGEDVRINDGQGTTYLCCLNRYEKDQAVLDVFRKLDTETELPSEIILFQGLPKGDKMEWIVQKSVELGAHKIVPFSAKRSVVKLDEKKAGTLAANRKRSGRAVGKRRDSGSLRSMFFYGSIRTGRKS